MTKKLSLLTLFLVVGVGTLFAQNTVNLTNQGGNTNYQNGFWTYANLVSKGYINYYTGPVSLSGDSFAGNGAVFGYSVPNVGSGQTQNVSGSLVLQSSSTSGQNTVCNYVLTLTFSGYDSNGHAFSGTSSQLITVKVSQGGQYNVSTVGGTTSLTTY